MRIFYWSETSFLNAVKRSNNSYWIIRPATIRRRKMSGLKNITRTKLSSEHRQDRSEYIRGDAAMVSCMSIWQQSSQIDMFQLKIS